MKKLKAKREAAQINKPWMDLAGAMEIIGFHRLLIKSFIAKREAAEIKKSQILSVTMELIGFD